MAASLDGRRFAGRTCGPGNCHTRPFSEVAALIAISQDETMDRESQIMALVEEILDSNCLPDEACRDHPDLLPDVRERLQRFHSMEAHVGEVFPPRVDAGGLL